MAYTYKQNLVSSSKYSIKCPYSLTPQYIVVHDTANSAPASNEISYMIRNDNQVSFHIAVDEKEAIQGLPLNRNSWSCGDGTNGNGNRKGISVEICRPTNSNRSLYDQSEENAVYVVARLLHKHGLGIDRLKRHYDFATNKKQCPNVIIREGRWDNFKYRVEWVLGEIKKGTIESSLESGTTGLKNNSSSTSTNTSTSKPSPYKVGDYNGKVKVTSSDGLNVRSQRNATSSIVGTLAKGTVIEVGYIMYENNQTTGSSLWGGVIVNGKQGFINLSYTEPTSSSTTSNSFLVEIICDSLNIRQKADFDSKVVGTVKRGEVFTIVEESNGLGLLKSYASNRNGWISMGSAYVKKK